MTETIETNNKIRIEKALAFFSGLNMEEETIGKHSVNEWFFYSVSEYLTVPDTEKQYESHKKYADIQWIITGEEFIQYVSDTKLSAESTYDEENDITFFLGNDYSSQQKLVSGCFAIIMPNEAHKSGIMVKNSSRVRKLVGKVLME